MIKNLNKKNLIVIYEWWLALGQLTNFSFVHKNCFSCIETAKLIEKLIGRNEVKRLKALVKKFPYK